MDAVVRRANADVVFTIIDNRAKMIIVDVVGYKSSFVGFTATEDIPFVITRGNERLSDGQQVRTN
jgi:hypothetical protein